MAVGEPWNWGYVMDNDIDHVGQPGLGANDVYSGIHPKQHALRLDTDQVGEWLLS